MSPRPPPEVVSFFGAALPSLAGAELFSDVCQHNREHHRQQLLEQVAVADTPLGQRRRDLFGVITPEQRCNRLMPVALVDLVQAPTDVEQPTGGLTAGNGLNPVGMLGIFRVVLQSAKQRRNQRLNRAVHLTFVNAELACDTGHRNLGIDFIDTGHRFHRSLLV